MNANAKTRGSGKARGGRGREGDGSGGEHLGAGPTWRYPQLSPSGVLRIAPVAFESTASYLGRLADAYRMGVAQLLDGLGVELDGPGWRTGPGPAAPRIEIRLDTEALHRLAAFTRIPHNHLAHALPRLITTPVPPCARPAEPRRPAPTTRWGRPASTRKTRRGRGRPARGYASWTPTNKASGPARCAYDAAPAGRATWRGRTRPRTACGARATDIGRARSGCRVPSTRVGSPRSTSRIGPTDASHDATTAWPRIPGRRRSPPAGTTADATWRGAGRGGWAGSPRATPP
ncbi:TniQ family protein [Embleya sp. NPDC005575]|uniref:TniQ family protein n=1 Tax=Embleya sp. NPDC005575 TaxID=3156892 RepID=UPI0033A32414